jgi:hypothetical protein
MRWAWQSTALAVTVAFVVHGLFVPSAGAGTRTDREEARLKGPVQMVRTATTHLDGREGGLPLIVTTTYDRTGNKTTEAYGIEAVSGIPAVSPSDSAPHKILYF